jgi:hypothetical protein
MSDKQTTDMVIYDVDGVANDTTKDAAHDAVIDIPDDIWETIFTYLDAKVLLCTIRIVNKYWNKLSKTSLSQSTSSIGLLKYIDVNIIYKSIPYLKHLYILEPLPNNQKLGNIRQFEELHTLSFRGEQKYNFYLSDLENTNIYDLNMITENGVYNNVQDLRMKNLTCLSISDMTSLPTNIETLSSLTTFEYHNYDKFHNISLYELMILHKLVQLKNLTKLVFCGLIMGNMDLTRQMSDFTHLLVLEIIDCMLVNHSYLKYFGSIPTLEIFRCSEPTNEDVTKRHDFTGIGQCKRLKELSLACRHTLVHADDMYALNEMTNLKIIILGYVSIQVLFTGTEHTHQARYRFDIFQLTSKLQLESFMIPRFGLVAQPTTMKISKDVPVWYHTIKRLSLPSAKLYPNDLQFVCCCYRLEDLVLNYFHVDNIAQIEQICNTCVNLKSIVIIRQYDYRINDGQKLMMMRKELIDKFPRIKFEIKY